MGNCPDLSVPPKCGMLDVLRNPCFAQGYRSIRRGKAPDTSTYSEHKKWFYERGRLIAGEAQEKFGHVPKLRIVRHAGHRSDGYLINPKIIDLAWPMLAELPNPYTGANTSEAYE